MPKTRRASSKQVRYLVLDTSVAAKWFIQEPDSELAVDLLREVAQGRWQLIAPDLIRWELTHVFWKRRSLGYTHRQLQLALQELESLGLQEVPGMSLFSKAVEMAYQWEIAVYDACYVALAQEFKGILATFDEVLKKRLRRHSSINLLEFKNP